MHCKACEILLETELGKNPEIASIKANSADKQVIIKTKSDMETEALLADLNQLITTHGYILASGKITEKNELERFGIDSCNCSFDRIYFFITTKTGYGKLD